MLKQDKSLQKGCTRIILVLASKGFKTVPEAEKAGYDVLYNDILKPVYVLRKA